jgi:hypothetical protein
MSQQQTSKTTIERAYEIASSGSVKDVDAINRQLYREGYFTNMLIGPTLVRELKARIAASRQTSAVVAAMQAGTLSSHS